MTDTSFGINDPRTQKKWAVDMFDDAIGLHRLGPLMGDDENAPICMNQDLTRGPGGSVLFECWDELNGAGVGDDGDTTNQAQALTAKNQSVFVHTRATRSQAKGNYSLQLTSLRGTDAFRRKAKEKLANWIVEVTEKDLIGAATGEYNENYSSADVETINEVYPSANRILRLGQTIGSTPALDNNEVSYTTEALLSAATRTSNLFGTLVIDKARIMAVTASPRVRPTRVFKQSASRERSVQFPVQGELVGDMYLIFVSPYQLAHLRHEIGANSWAVACQTAAQMGNVNPLFTGATLVWNGCVVYEWERIPTRTGAGGTTLAEGFELNADRTATTDAVANTYTLARGFLLGANALLFAWAMPFGWWEDYYDANKPFIKTEGLYGVKVNQWNAHGGSSAGSEVSRICIETFI